MLKVVVPPNTPPGAELLVKSPDGRTTMSARVPEGLKPGQEFFVRMPATPAVNNNALVQSSAVGQSKYQQQMQTRPPNQPQKQPQGERKKYKRCSPEMILLGEKGLVNVKVPKGLMAGDKFRLVIPDGRTVNAVVPKGNVREFQMKVPVAKQNWHDNVLAVTPMTIGPMLM